jgi:hypothetical protein
MSLQALYQRLKELDRDQFEKLCFHLLKAKYPLAKVRHVEGKAGDEGIDSYAGRFGGKLVIWQCKSFANGGQSGNKKIVVMRRGCNNRLRNAVYHWSRVATMCDERNRSYYGQLRARGHSHGRALRTLADRWLTALVAMLRTHETFDAAKWNACVITPQATL